MPGCIIMRFQWKMRSYFAFLLRKGLITWQCDLWYTWLWLTRYHSLTRNKFLGPSQYHITSRWQDNIIPNSWWDLQKSYGTSSVNILAASLHQFMTPSQLIWPLRSEVSIFAGDIGTVAKTQLTTHCVWLPIWIQSIFYKMHVHTLI